MPRRSAYPRVDSSAGAPMPDGEKYSLHERQLSSRHPKVGANLSTNLGIVTSSAASWMLTRRVGRFVHDYVRHRRALDEVVECFSNGRGA